GATNFIPFTPKNRSRFTAMMNSRQLSLSFQGQGRRLLGRAAEAEAWRRLIIMAIGLERYRVKQGTYPKELLNLEPEFVPSLPVDFMDGKPLRYRRTDDGHFLLYSIGLDCVDDGGQMRRRRNRNMPDQAAADYNEPIDIVWPRPASEAEASRLQEE